MSQSSSAVSHSTIRLGARPWGFLAPLELGLVESTGGPVVHMTNCQVTPELLSDTRFDASETSFSRYVRYRQSGGSELVALPIWFMRGFRHQCFLVRRDSELHTLSQLAGGTIGLTGWPDSGNTWTRALLRDAGVDLAACSWVVGRLHTNDVKPAPRSDPSYPANVQVLPADGALVDELRAGRVDAILTPFMPPHFHEENSDLRFLLDDLVSEEKAYYRRMGFIPGIHLLAVRADLESRVPGAFAALFNAVQKSWEWWWSTKVFLGGDTPFELSTIHDTILTFGDHWSPFGYEDNKNMVETFCRELFEQGILDAPVKDPQAWFISPSEIRQEGRAAI